MKIGFVVQSERGRPSQCGAVLILLSSLILVLLVLFGIIGIIGFAYLVRTELQTVADSAAHAGTSLLCTSEECWKNSQLAAARVIAKQDTHVGPGGEKILDFDFNPTSASAPTWTSSSSSLIVTIERGRWSPKSGFTSLEALLKANPSLLPYVVANSVRVNLTRSRLAPFLPRFLATEFPITVTSTAVFEEMKPVCAAPFAIPYCALLSKERNYSKKRAKKRDRLFAAAARHCTGDADGICGNYPSFPIGPSDNRKLETSAKTCTEPTDDAVVEEDDCEEEPRTGCPTGADKIERFGFSIPIPTPTLNPLGFPPVEKVKVSVDKLPRFNTDRYDATIKNYGVFGLAQSSAPDQATLLTDVRRYLDGTANQQGCVSNTTLGDTFKVLGEGLRGQGGNDDNALVWSRITGQFAGKALAPAADILNPDSEYPPYYLSNIGEKAEVYKPAGGSYLEGNALEINSYWGYCDLDSANRVEGQSVGCWWCPNPNNGVGHRLYLPFDDDAKNDNYGLCNSTRFSRAIQRWIPPGSDVDNALRSALSIDQDPRTLLSPRNWNADKMIERAVRAGTLSAEMGQEVAKALGNVILDMHFNRVWVTEVPIIMKQGGGPDCEFQDGDPNTPADDTPVDPSINWEVVGFVKMGFYDVDIGSPAPTAPTSSGGAPLTFPVPGSSPALVFPPVPASSPPPHPYQFTQYDGTPSCNVVRARIIDADSAIQRTNHDKRRTVLVQ